MCKGEQFDKYYLQKVFETLNEKEVQNLLTLLNNGKIKSAQQFDDGFQKMIKKKQDQRKKKELEEKMKKQ